MKSHLLLAAAMFAVPIAAPTESRAQDRPMQTMTMRAHPLPVEGSLPSFAGVITWLNSQPLTPEALRGKVVLVDFWTYTPASTGSAPSRTCAPGRGSTRIRDWW